MHCPKCGTPIETEDISYCTRCGQPLDRLRAAISDTPIEGRNIETSHASLNLGVVLMYIGIWPAFAFRYLLADRDFPAVLATLVAVWFAILLGSGPLLRLFQHYEMPKEIERARRREIAFGSTLMFFASIIATMMVALTTGRSLGADATIIVAITGVFVLLLASSKILFQGYRKLATNKPEQTDSADQQALATGSLDAPAVQLPSADARSLTDTAHPPSVTENTTRHLATEMQKPLR